MQHETPAAPVAPLPAPQPSFLSQAEQNSVSPFFAAIQPAPMQPRNYFAPPDVSPEQGSIHNWAVGTQPPLTERVEAPDRAPAAFMPLSVPEREQVALAQFGAPAPQAFFTPSAAHVPAIWQTGGATPQHFMQPIPPVERPAVGYQVPPAPLFGEVQYPVLQPLPMLEFRTLCQMCHSAPPNEGYSLCQACFQAPPKCTKCFVQTPTPGKRQCPQCYHTQQQQLSGPMCSDCHMHRTTKGTPLCAQCLFRSHKGVFFAKLDPTHPKYPGIKQQFESTWTAWGGKFPTVISIFSVFNPNSYQRYMQYQTHVAHRNHGKPNERRLFHGCALECQLLRTERFCASTTCVACNICLKGFEKRPTRFNTLQFGNGFYFAFHSSKSDKFARNSESVPGYRMLLLCKVTAGRPASIDRDTPSLQAPPNGFDSVLAVVGPQAKVTQPEVVVYNCDAALPAYIIIYKV
eukprot:TRINITY_DN14810_c0_g1_i1.p1 TRINITY_DN14810_c0_g1~~TRINITY_DN14810_c0_g1_i1.p1  ORF type:complete len:527 (-),score=47.87 TRINITY_DN14810_c0_g1_i1:12-1388(-)